MNRIETGTEPAASRRPRRAMIILFILAGVAAGLGGFTFFFAQGASYLTDDPKTCMNCHIMRSHFDDWNRGPHKAAATCNDCHTPKDFIGHWAIKGLNGFNHGRAFTTGHFHEPIQIRPINKKVLQANCFRCHESLVGRMGRNSQGEETDCSRCHRETGH